MAGDATFEGEFFGPIRVRNVTKTTRYASEKADLTLVHMTGRLELDSGEIDVSDVSGSAKLTTHDKDMDVENVAGGWTLPTPTARSRCLIRSLRARTSISPMSPAKWT